MKLSVIVPARNERYLEKTVKDIYKKFHGDFEVIVVLDGLTDHPIPDHYHNMIVIDKRTCLASGIRKSINDAVLISSGDYIMKVDAHCMFCDDFDTILLKDIEEDWVMVARRWTLDLETWVKSPRNVDYYYLSCPWTHPRPLMMQSCPWISRTEERASTPIDDLMCFQGSMWMMSRRWWGWLGGLEVGAEEYAEHHEISMKTWLGGGRIVINKNAWYAHPRKDSRGYHMNMDRVYKDHDHSARYWTENSWRRQVHNFDWLIDKFWPLPTEHHRHRIEKYYWPEDWKKYYDHSV